MKVLVNELSRMTDTPVETIRGYRKAGLLHPVPDPNNHYYYYTEKDVFALFTIKRFRQTNMSLSSIKEYMDGVAAPEDILEAEVERKRNELNALQRELEILETRLLSAKECRENRGKIILKYNRKTKIDFPILPLQKQDPEAFHLWLKHLDVTPMSLHVDRQYLSSSAMDHDSHPVFCFGCHLQKIEELQLPIPKVHYRLEAGWYLSMICRIETNRNIAREDYAPLIRYAEENGIHFTSDLTGYLIQTLMEEGKTYNYFRIRIRTDRED